MIFVGFLNLKKKDKKKVSYYRRILLKDIFIQYESWTSNEFLIELFNLTRGWKFSLPSFVAFRNLNSWGKNVRFCETK